MLPGHFSADHKATLEPWNLGRYLLRYSSTEDLEAKGYFKKEHT